MKKLNHKGLSHHLILISIAVLAVVAGTGYFVWNRQKTNNMKAKAATWKTVDTIYDDNDKIATSLTACKTDSGYSNNGVWVNTWDVSIQAYTRSYSKYSYIHSFYVNGTSSNNNIVSKSITVKPGAILRKSFAIARNNSFTYDTDVQTLGGLNYGNIQQSKKYLADLPRC